MGAGCEERAEPLGGAWNGVGTRYPEGIEAVRASYVGKRTLGRGRRQKSRLA